MSAIAIDHFLPSLSAMPPRIRAPKMAPMVVPAVMISCSCASRTWPRSDPTIGRADPTMAVS